MTKIFNTKLYILEEMTQEELNELALERNTLQQRIDKAIEYIEKNIHFCENDSQGAYDVCNIRIASDKKLLEILRGKDEYKLPFDEEVQSGLDSLSIRGKDER